MKKNILLFFILIIFPIQLFSSLSLPNYFTDNMVIQRNKPIRIWGLTNASEKVTITFNNKTQIVKSDLIGNWSVTFNALSAGGPYTLSVKVKKEELEIKNILIGDIWICGGQSNMEWVVNSSINSDEEISNANYPLIRILTVQKNMSFKPLKNIDSVAWKEVTPQNIAFFSAVGYFFGRFIHQNEKIPIGLISSNWGGTAAEAWTSLETLSQFDYLSDQLTKIKNISYDFPSYRDSINTIFKNWKKKYYIPTDIGIDEKWFSTEYNDSNWESIKVPQRIENIESLKNFDGVIWFRKSFRIPPLLRKKTLFLRLGYINDFDITYINGHKVGETYNEKKWRVYSIPQEYLYADKENVVTIRVFDGKNEGGLTEIVSDNMNLSLVKYGNAEESVALSGIWKYKIGKKIDSEIKEDVPLPCEMSPNEFPSSLYNAMIAPFTPFAIKGVIWYQGEANAPRAFKYRELFPAMINDWRKKWGYNFPFLYVQLANFNNNHERCTIPCSSTWAELREAQQMALALPLTGMACIIDIGEAYDIHPKNKQEVGRRLGLTALTEAYGKDVIFMGPAYISMINENDKIRIKIDVGCSHLKINNRYGYIQGFTIAGNDKKFYWAKAYAEGDDIIVYSDKVKNPVAVRYAWEDNPEDINVFNEEGLPLIPFRTDNWDGITIDK